MATAVTPTPNRSAMMRARDRVRQQIDKAKQAIAKDIAHAIDAAGLTQSEAFYMTGQAQSQLSLIRNGHLDGFSMERLIEIRSLLGATVTMVIVGESVAHVRVDVR